MSMKIFSTLEMPSQSADDLPLLTLMGLSFKPCLLLMFVVLILRWPDVDIGEQRPPINNVPEGQSAVLVDILLAVVLHRLVKLRAEIFHGEEATHDVGRIAHLGIGHLLEHRHRADSDQQDNRQKPVLQLLNESFAGLHVRFTIQGNRRLEA